MTERRDLPPVAKRPPGDQQKTDAALPKLELRQLMRSEKPINDVENEKLKIEAVRPWNNYTIVTLEGSDEIRIFDEDARKIDDFKKPQSNKKIVIDWQDQGLARKVGKPEIGKDTRNDPNEQKISQVPLELRGPARKKLEQRNYFKVAELQLEEFLPDDMIVLEKYIIFPSRQGTYFAFETQNEHGVVLAPRDWKRIDPSKPYPPELSKYGEKILGEHEGYKQLNEKYSAFVTDVGINIVNKDGITSQPLFSDNVPSVEKNVTADPSNHDTIYYCQGNNPRNIVRLDMSGDPQSWQPVLAELPQKYDSVRNLQLDPSGNFFLFYSKQDLVIISKATLEEVGRMPELSQVNFDDQGRIRAVDKDGHLVIYEPQFEGLAKELEKRRIAKLAEGVKITDIFDLKAVKGKQVAEGGEDFEYLALLRGQYEEQFAEVLTNVATREEVAEVRKRLGTLHEVLRKQGLKQKEVAYIVAGLEKPVETKEKEFAANDAREALVLIRATLAAGLSVASLSEARNAMNSVKASEALLDEDLRREAREVAQELELRSLELFNQRGGEIIKDV